MSSTSELRRRRAHSADAITVRDREHEEPRQEIASHAQPDTELRRLDDDLELCVDRECQTEMPQIRDTSRAPNEYRGDTDHRVVQGEQEGRHLRRHGSAQLLAPTGKGEPGRPRAPSLADHA